MKIKLYSGRAPRLYELFRDVVFAISCEIDKKKHSDFYLANYKEFLKTCRKFLEEEYEKYREENKEVDFNTFLLILREVGSCSVVFKKFKEFCRKIGLENS